MVAGRKDKGFERVINCESCRETLVLLEPWFSPRPTSRVWCLYEILLTIMAGRTITVMSPPGAGRAQQGSDRGSGQRAACGGSGLGGDGRGDDGW